MKLYNGMSPNGMRVSVFLAEKGIEIPTTNIDIMAGGARTPDYLKINSLGEVPVLVLDDGHIITESLAICRYLEALHPEPSLMGTTALEQANIEMWTRRMEQQIFKIAGDIGLHEIPIFADKIEQLPEYSATLRRAFPKKLAWLDSEISDGRPFIAGNTFSVADITGMAALMVSGFVNADIPSDLKHVGKWAHSMQSRPSWPKMPG